MGSEEPIISSVTRDLSEVMEGKNGAEGAEQRVRVLKADINNIEFGNKLLPLFSVFACNS